MRKIETFTDLIKLKQELQEKLIIKQKGIDKAHPIQVKVAMATCGIASGAREVMEYFLEEMEKRNIEALVTPTGCMGYCYAEPTIEVTLFGREPVVFGNVDIRRADEIIEKYIKNGELTNGIIPVNYETIDIK